MPKNKKHIWTSFCRSEFLVRSSINWSEFQIFGSELGLNFAYIGLNLTVATVIIQELVPR